MPKGISRRRGKSSPASGESGPCAATKVASTSSGEHHLVLALLTVTLLGGKALGRSDSSLAEIEAAAGGIADRQPPTPLGEVDHS